MGQPHASGTAAAARGKKEYSRPEALAPNREQVALLLLGLAWEGDRNAKKLLDLGADALFPPLGEARTESA